MNTRLPPAPATAFLTDKLRRVAGGCLVWKTAPARSWYRTVQIGGKRYNVRRLLYSMGKGLTSLPPRGVRLTMTCNNPSCLNHLHMTGG